MTSLINNAVMWLNSIVLTPVNTVFGVLLIVGFFGFFMGVVIGKRGWH